MRLRGATTLSCLSHAHLEGLVAPLVDLAVLAGRGGGILGRLSSTLHGPTIATLSGVAWALPVLWFIINHTWTVCQFAPACESWLL